MEDNVQLQKRSTVRALQRNEKTRPPEGGWGWMVAFGMALMFVGIGYTLNENFMN